MGADGAPVQREAQDYSTPLGQTVGVSPSVPFREALRFWLKLGFISFGGPAGQIAIMHTELVEKKRWISERRFLHALNYCMILPGPEATQLATYVGWLMHGFRGGLLAGVLFVLPSLILLIGLSWVYAAHGDVWWISGIFDGMKPAVVAIVAHAAYRVGKRTIRNGVLAAVAVSAFLALAWLKVPFPYVVIGAAAVGVLGGRYAPQFFQASRHGEEGDLEDQREWGEHTKFKPSRLAAVLGTGVLLWALPIGLLAGALGWSSMPAQMGLFFTKAALLTFGGAYAVLPYVSEAATTHFGWLTQPQMIDGLALGETTPGPLIMVVAFVGFMGGWQGGWLESLGLSGVAGALIATYYTFLPSFVFIFAGAPLVEATHGELRFTAPLTAVTAAVSGVIANLALFFALAVFWPQGWGTPMAIPTVGIAAVAAIALFRYRVGVVPLLLVCGIVGLILRLL